MRAGIGEGAALGQPPLEIDDLANRRQPLRRLDDFPALAVAKAELQHVEVQCRVEVVAVGPVAVDVLDPGHDAAVEVDVVVDRHRQHFAIVALADLVAGVEVDHGLVEDRVLRSELRRGRERAGRGVAVRHVELKAEIGLDVGKEAAEPRMRRRRDRGDDVERRAIDAARHPLAAFLQAEADQPFDRVPRVAGLVRGVARPLAQKSISASA